MRTLVKKMSRIIGGTFGTNEKAYKRSDNASNDVSLKDHQQLKIHL